ncbi:hypothetical protein FB387_002082 [Streptomyces cinereoruber]|nr:hypothetical protein [Streptomyces cinereoruber]NIH60953.1 hypothetical protein [Streptomyces cinereoruber]
MKTAARLTDAASNPLVARLHVDLCRCMSAACCRREL